MARRRRCGSRNKMVQNKKKESSADTEVSPGTLQMSRQILLDKERRRSSVKDKDWQKVFS